MLRSKYRRTFKQCEERQNAVLCITWLAIRFSIGWYIQRKLFLKADIISVWGHINKVLTCLSLFYYHFQGDKHKILENCTLPLTGTNCVDMIITEKVGCWTAPFSVVCRDGLFCSANDDTIFGLRNDLLPSAFSDAETGRELGRVKKIISRDRLTGLRRGGEGEERRSLPLARLSSLFFY